MRRPDYCVCLFKVTLTISIHDFGSWQVDHFEVTFSVYHKVLRLDIPANDSLGGEILEYQDDGGSEELTIIGREKADCFKDVIEISTFDGLIEVVEVVVALELAPHRHYERTREFFQNFPFFDCKFAYIVCFQLFLFYNLQDIFLLTIFDQKEGSELPLRREHVYYS